MVQQIILGFITAISTLILAVAFALVETIIFWITWCLCGLGEKFFYFAPEVFLNPGFFEIFGLFIIFNILKSFSPFKS